MSRLPSLLLSLGLMSLSKKGQIKRFDSWLDFFFLSLTVSGAGLLHWRRRCIEMATNWLLDLYDSQQHSAWCCQKPKTRRKTSLTFRIVILLRHVPSVPARRLSDQPPRTRLHSPSQRGQRRQSRTIWRYFYFFVFTPPRAVCQLLIRMSGLCLSK